jgi:hypothetical protein
VTDGLERVGDRESAAGELVTLQLHLVNDAAARHVRGG